MLTIPPTYTPISRLVSDLQTQGYAVLPPADVCTLIRCELAELQSLAPSWSNLPQDHYLKDSGNYRQRRHSCFIVDANGVELTPHRSHWQPLEYNALHGGLRRMFEPITQEFIDQPVWSRLLQATGNLFSQVKGQQVWFVEAHQFRIDTHSGIGRPTPEGAHRDGVDFVAILLINRINIKGGESRIFDAAGSNGKRFTLIEPWTLLLLDDERVIHEATPIQPTGENGHRDTLVLTYRRGGFQEGP
ncbi:MAG: 2OG-Fe dioxygenase family protein [Burkholderiales bacterium]